MDALRSLRKLGVDILQTWPRALRACEDVWDDARFQEGIASAGHHPVTHQVPGGLVLHTLEVARASVDLADNSLRLMQRAFVAAVFHDYGKVHEYARADGRTLKLPFASRIGHIVYGWAYFRATADKHKLAPEDIEEIAHAILAHHGRLEWGSPVTPQTRLAFILHTADMLSAKGLEC